MSWPWDLPALAQPPWASWELAQSSPSPEHCVTGVPLAQTHQCPCPWTSQGQAASATVGISTQVIPAECRPLTPAALLALQSLRPEERRPCTGKGHSEAQIWFPGAHGHQASWGQDPAAGSWVRPCAHGHHCPWKLVCPRLLDTHQAAAGCQADVDPQCL